MPVTWYRNDKKLHTSRTVLISEDGKTHRLEIKEVTMDDISQIKAEVKGLHSAANLKVLGMIFVNWQSRHFYCTCYMAITIKQSFFTMDETHRTILLAFLLFHLAIKFSSFFSFLLSSFCTPLFGTQQRLCLLQLMAVLAYKASSVKLLSLESYMYLCNNTNMS